MSKPLNWGILGTSFISAVMADAILAEAQTHLYAVAGRSLAPLNDFTDKYDFDKVYQDYDALIADPQVDVIYIALPNHLHHEYVIKAAQAGKAILCEKSLSVDMAKTQAALDTVAEHKVFFLEGLMYLTHPFAQKISQLLQTKAIGEIKTIRGNYCAAISEFVNPESKGTLYNLGCYPLSLMHLVLQQAFGNEIFSDYQIQAFGRRGKDGNICDTSANFLFNNGVQVQLHTAEDFGMHSSFSILGSEGYLELKSNPWLPQANGNKIYFAKYDGEGNETEFEHIEVDAPGNGFVSQVTQVREALEQGLLELARPAARPQDSFTMMQLLTDWEAAAS